MVNGNTELSLVKGNTVLSFVNGNTEFSLVNGVFIGERKYRVTIG